MARNPPIPVRRSPFGFSFESYEHWMAARTVARRWLVLWVVITAIVVTAAYGLAGAGYGGAAAFLCFLWWPFPPWVLFRVGFSAAPAEVESWLQRQRALDAERSAARRLSPITYILLIAFFGLFAAIFWSFFAASPDWIFGMLAAGLTAIPVTIAWRWSRKSRPRG